MKHMHLVHSVDRPICQIESSVELLGDRTRSIYESVGCIGCLRRAIAEGEERTRVLRDLLGKVEAAS